MRVNKKSPRFQHLNGAISRFVVISRRTNRRPTVLKHFLPHFIQENYRAGNLKGRLHAYTMFVDLSGFTRLTEKLMAEGSEGAEEMSRILNFIFQPTVKLVYEQGGFIPYFAGDSFTAIFPNGGISHHETAAIALRVTEAAQATLRRFISDQEDEDSLLAEHKIGIKIGLSEGELEWGIVGNGRKGYYFRGDPIEGCSQAQVRACSLEVVSDEHFFEIPPP